MQGRKTSGGFIRNGWQCVRIVFSCHPGLFLLGISLSLIFAGLWMAQVVVMQRFFDIISEISGRGLTAAVVALLGLGVVFILYHVMDGISNCYPEIVALKINKRLNQALHRTIDREDLAEFEDTIRLEQMEKSINGADCVMWISMVITDIIFFYGAYFVFMGGYLYSLKPVLAVSIVIVFIPCVVSQLIRISTFKALEDQCSPLRREWEYYKTCVTAPDTRILGATQFFEQLFKLTLTRLNRLVFRVQLRKTLVDFGLNLITACGYGFIVYITFVAVMNKQISIGAFSAIVVSIGTLYRFMNKVVTERLRWATENISYAENYLNYVHEQPEHESKYQFPPNCNITLTNVSFKYPMSDHVALRDIHLEIKHNETVAIVGRNGSGKTTLCRLLVGLYLPTAGQVMYGDMDANICNHQNISAVFQNFKRYKMTLRDNITISESEKPCNDEQLQHICSWSGIDLDDKDYHQRLDTVLGREFGGIERSGGQWQRIAIARGLYRDSQFIVLDEPTAAIDPLQETRLYHDFINMSRNKTAIIVTHRMGIARLADRIIVIKDGKIAEQGTHHQLIAQHGEYKAMYDSQSEWYQEIHPLASSS